jgi:uncharacterized protein YjbI with pentapeptide repeats
MWFWWRGMVLHDLGVTAIGLVTLLVTIAVGVDNWNQARVLLGRKSDVLAARPLVTSVAVVAVLVAGLSLTVFRTGFVSVPMQVSVGQAQIYSNAAATEEGLAAFDQVITAALDVSGEELVDLPAGWQPPQLSRAAFLDAWCRQRGLDATVCSSAGFAPDYLSESRVAWCDTRSRFFCTNFFREFDEQMEQDWTAFRLDTLRNLPKLDLSGDDLRGALASSAGLVGANLRQADLSYARLDSSNMERTVLVGAKLQAADAYYALLDSANLTGADARSINLQNANLNGAVLVGARFSGANLNGASLVGAKLNAADLRGADLTEAHLERANLDGAILAGADLRGATGLTADQLSRAVGDEWTFFSDDAQSVPLHVQSCWETWPDHLSKLLGQPSFSDADRRELKQQLFCRAGEDPRPMGTPCKDGTVCRAQGAPGSTTHVTVSTRDAHPRPRED